MSAHVDLLIDEHNAPRARFEVQRIAHTEMMQLMKPFEGVRMWLNLIGATVFYLAADHEEAQTIIETALWCGSPHVEVEYCLPGRIVTETLAAVQS